MQYLLQQGWIGREGLDMVKSVRRNGLFAEFLFLGWFKFICHQALPIVYICNIFPRFMSYTDNQIFCTGIVGPIFN